MTTATKEKCVINPLRFNVATHNGKITIDNPQTGVHRTLRIRTEKWSNGEVHRVFSLLVGPDNNCSYKRLGFIKNGTAFTWRSHLGTKFDRYAQLINHIKHFMELGMEYLIEETCRKCNRTLTVPESIKSGIGPVCAGKQQ